MIYYVLFLFIAFGAKLILALAMIYMLLPTDRRCNQCNAETLLIRLTGRARLLTLLSFGRVQRRWCPRCEWYGLSRRIAVPAVRRLEHSGPRSRSTH